MREVNSRLQEPIRKRIERAGGDQPRRGTCIICAQDWMTCPHNRGETDAVLAIYNQDLILAKYGVRPSS